MFSNVFNFYTGDARLITPSNELIGAEGYHNLILNLTGSGTLAGSPTFYSDQASHYILMKFDRTFDAVTYPDLRLYLPFDWNVTYTLNTDDSMFSGIGTGYGLYYTGFKIYKITTPFELEDLNYNDVFLNESTHLIFNPVLAFSGSGTNCAVQQIYRFTIPQVHVLTGISSLVKIYGVVIKPYMFVEMSSFGQDSTSPFNFDFLAEYSLKLAPKPFITL